MRKRIVEVLILACFTAFMIIHSTNVSCTSETVYKAQNISIPEQHTILIECGSLRSEIVYGEIELLAQLVEAEAGNQDKQGKRYVADVPLNRVDIEGFPDNLEDVIFQSGQFSCITDGNFEKAEWNISEESYQIALEEYTGKRQNYQIIYFRTDRYSDYGTPAFRYGNHYFSTR